MAEAIALGINPDDNTGNMIINIGSESTSFAIIADGRIIISRKLQVGGKQMTEQASPADRLCYRPHAEK